MRSSILARLGFVLALTTVMPSLANAQGSGKGHGRPAVYPNQGGAEDDPFARDRENPFSVSRWVDARVVAVDLTNELMVVELEGSERFRIPVEDVPLKAEKGSGVLAEGDPVLADFPIGATVKITYRPHDEQVTEIKAREARKEKVRGTILEVRADAASLVVEDEDGEALVLHADDETEFEAEDGSGAPDRDDLALDAYPTGASVEVEYRVFDGRLLKLKARRP